MRDGKWEKSPVILSETQSVCPECLQRIPAQRVLRGDHVFLQKYCPEHGNYEACIWKGAPDYQHWTNALPPAAPAVFATEVKDGCPFDCGLCPAHRQQTCCVLLEVTNQCNLQCPVCFAEATPDKRVEPDITVIEGWYRMLMESGGPYNIQLSGGEPTLRDDLPEIIAMGKQMGFEFFQVNTNGLRLATDEKFIVRLKAAGLNCVFLQFDGTDDSVYMKLRGKALLSSKKKVIKACRTHDLGVVLVPTLVPGVNDSQIGDILNFAIDNMPVVRGVHFQPISYFGRYPKVPSDEDRLTIPQILREIEKQTNGRMKTSDFRPPSGEHAYCSFHGDFLLLPGGGLKPLLPVPGASCCSAKPGIETAKRSRQFVARQWSAAKQTKIQAEERSGKFSAGNLSSLDEFLTRVNTYKLAVSGMAFQDVWTLDLERLQQCYIHVVSQDNRLIPFCAYNLTSQQGKALYRRT